MARVVDSFPGQGRSPRYPWDEWLDGQARILTIGEDFRIPVASFRAQVSINCKARGLTGRTRTISDTELAVQALGARNGHGAE